MDRAEAIGFLNYEYKAACNAYTTHLVNNRPQDPQTEEWLDALGIAISALREQEQREQGCGFCRVFAFNAARVETTKHEFKFCPKCGCKLKEGADHEHKAM